MRTILVSQGAMVRPPGDIDDFAKLFFWIVITMKNTVFKNQKMNSASGR